MITLYRFGAQWGLFDASPFVLKVDAFLRMNALSYEVKSGAQYLKKSPKSKLPFIIDSGEVIGDSAFIFKYLTDKYNLTIDQHLSKGDQAKALLYSKSLDESLYWCLLYSRWIANDTWPTFSQAIFDSLPRMLKFFVPEMLRQGVKKSLKRQGYGHHSEAELQQIAQEHFSALSVLLGDNPYFFGDTISSFDANAFAMLAQFILVPLDNRFNQLAQSHQNLVDYCHRINQRYYLAEQAR